MGGVPARGGQHWITGFVSGIRVRVERERETNSCKGLSFLLPTLWPWNTLQSKMDFSRVI